MTNQEKRTKSGEIILSLVQAQTATTVKEAERKLKLPHEEIVAFFKDLAEQGQGRFIVGRRGAPSRFVRFRDERAEDPAAPLDIRAEIRPDGMIELRLVTSPDELGRILRKLKGEVTN